MSDYKNGTHIGTYIRYTRYCSPNCIWLYDLHICIDILDRDVGMGESFKPLN